MLLREKVVVVTGSTRGIGRAIAEACAAQGARVVVSSRTGGNVESVCRELAHKGHNVSGFRADVTVPGDLESLLEHAVSTWGRVDVWINNAGLSSGFLPLDQIGNDVIERVVQVNLTAVLRACRLLIAYFKKHGGGMIINISGRGGRGDASPYMSVYAASKAGVASATKSLALETKGHPISIHVVMPGMVETDMFEDVQTSPEVEAQMRSLPYVFKAFGTTAAEVGEVVVRVASQRPGRRTGRTYSLLKGIRLARGIALMMWYRTLRKI